MHPACHGWSVWFCTLPIKKSFRCVKLTQEYMRDTYLDISASDEDATRVGHLPVLNGGFSSLPHPLFHFPSLSVAMPHTSYASKTKGTDTRGWDKKITYKQVLWTCEYRAFRSYAASGGGGYFEEWLLPPSSFLPPLSYTRWTRNLWGRGCWKVSVEDHYYLRPCALKANCTQILYYVNYYNLIEHIKRVVNVKLCVWNRNVHYANSS